MLQPRWQSSFLPVPRKDEKERTLGTRLQKLLHAYDASVSDVGDACLINMERSKCIISKERKCSLKHSATYAILKK